MINISKLYCGLGSESDHLRYSKKNNYGPVVVLNCTKKCNLKCRHCYSSSEAVLGESELSKQEIFELIDDIAGSGSPVILFSGGEPLLRGDLFELLERARQAGLRTVISTNGTLIDEATARRLKEVGLGYAGVSLDGEKEIHDKFRGKQGCYEATLKGMANCRSAGLKTGLRFTITKSNASQVGRIFEIARDNDIRRICFYHLIRMGRARDICDESPGAELSREVVDLIIDKTKEYVEGGYLDEVLTVGNHADGPYLLLRMLEEGNENFRRARELLRINGGNKIGEKIACVSWDGNVYADQFWRNYSLGNIRDKRFSEIWYGEGDEVLNKLRHKDDFAAEKCRRCGWFDLCKGNFRFVGAESGIENWVNEPECYLSENEISILKESEQE